jgi:hypothetical protein
MTPTHVLVMESIDCKNCGSSGYEPGHEPTEPGKPYRWCSTCQGQKVRHRAMSLKDFAKLLNNINDETCVAPFATTIEFLSK